jgi:hypothetical protein
VCVQRYRDIAAGLVRRMLQQWEQGIATSLDP